MRKNNFYLSLLGDFYQTVGVNALLQTVDSVYSDFLFRKYDSIVHRYLQSDKLGYCILKTCFIDMSSYSYENGFKIIDILKKDVHNIVSISSSKDFSFYDIEEKEGFYKIPLSIRNNAIEKGLDYALVYVLVKNESKKNNTAASNMINFVPTRDIQKDAIELITFSRLNNFISRKQIGNFVDILLGSPFVATKEEKVIEVSEDGIKTDKNIYKTMDKNIPTNFSVGDTIPLGTPFYRLCRFSNEFFHSKVLLELERKISSNPSNIGFLKTLFKNIAKTTAIVELDSTILDSSSKDALDTLSILSDYVSAQKIIFTSKPIEDGEMIGTNVEKGFLSTEPARIASINTYTSEVQMVCASTANIQDECFFEIIDSETIVSNEKHSYLDAKMEESTTVIGKKISSLIEEDSSEVTSTEKWEDHAKLQEISIGSLTDEKFMVTKFSDVFSFAYDNESTGFIIENSLKAEMGTKVEKIGKIVRKSIIGMKEIPVIAQSFATVAESSWSKSYYSETKESQTILLREEDRNIFNLNANIESSDYITTTIKMSDSFAGGSKGKGSGILELSETFTAESMLEKPIISATDEINVEDYAFVISDNQIDF